MVGLTECSHVSGSVKSLNLRMSRHPVAWSCVNGKVPEDVRIDPRSMGAVKTKAYPPEAMHSQRYSPSVCAGGLLSEDSPFLDVVREGLKLALPSAEAVHPRVQPAHGAALLLQDRLFGGVSAAGGNGLADGAGASGLFRTPDRPRHRHHRRTPSSQGPASFFNFLFE